VYEYHGEWGQPTVVEPLYGYLVYVNHSGVISLSYDESVNQTAPRARSLSSKKWYTIGASTQTTETASTLLNAAKGKYDDKYIVYMVNGVYFSMNDTGSMVFGRGYWLYTTGTTSITGRLKE